MKKISFTLLFAAVVIASCKNTPVTTNATKLEIATDSTMAHYQCPMKCQGDTAYTTTGKCQMCEMDLEKVN